MCNEYRLRQPLHRLVEDFEQLEIALHWEGGAPNLEPRDSIRPTDPAQVLIGAKGGAELKQLRWGFAQEKGGPLINYRSEGRRFGPGRCLVPADGFYEFTGPKAPKSKWLFTAANDEFFAIAGLAREERFTMLTMEPGPDIAPFHNRQIVILPRSQWAQWLDPAAPQPAFAALPAGSLKVVQIR